MPQITIHVPAHHVKAYSYVRNVKAHANKPPKTSKRVKLPKTLRRVKGRKRVAFIGPQRP